MRKNKGACIEIAKRITELLEGINKIVASRTDVKQDEVLMENIQKLER
jgi:hypothetical protein